MKKLAFILIIVLGLGGFGLAKAQTDPCQIDFTTATHDQLSNCLISLMSQLIVLEQEQIALNQSLQTTIQQIPTTTTIYYAPAQPTLGSAPSTPIASPTPPAPIETMTLNANLVSDNKWGKMYQVFAVYEENGNPVEGVPVTLTADDNGKITHSGVADKYGIQNNKELTNTQVQVFNQGYTIGAEFEYLPSSTGTRTLTVQGNNATQTIQVDGLNG